MITAPTYVAFLAAVHAAARKACAAIPAGTVEDMPTFAARVVPGFSELGIPQKTAVYAMLRAVADLDKTLPTQTIHATVKGKKLPVNRLLWGRRVEQPQAVIDKLEDIA